MISINSINALQAFNVLRFGATVLISIFLARSGLPTAEISIYETFLLLSNLVSFFWSMGGQSALIQYFPLLDKAGQRKALFNTFFLFFLLSLLGAITLYGFKSFLLNQFTNLESFPYIELICIFLIFNAPTLLIHIYYLLLKKYQKLLIFGIISFSLQIMAVALPLFMGYTLQETFEALIALAVFKFCWCLWILFQSASFQLDFSFIKKYSLLTLPLMLQMLIGHSMEYIDGLIVISYFEEKMFAIYRYGARELPAILLVTALATALIPEVTSDLQTGLKRIKEKTLQISHWLYPLSIVGMFASPIVYPLVFNADFEQSALVFNVYLLLLSSRILLPQVIILSQQKNYILVVSAIIETIVNIILSLVFVQYYGIEGIAFASVIAFFIDKLLLIIYTYKVLKISFRQYVNVKYYLIYNTLLFACFFGMRHL